MDAQNPPVRPSAVRAVGMKALLTSSLLAILAALPVVRDAARDVSLFWGPVSDWRPIVLIIPLLLSIVASIALMWAQLRRMLLLALPLTLGWAYLLVMNLLSSGDF
jgi:hypothetical protein